MERLPGEEQQDAAATRERPNAGDDATAQTEESRSNNGGDAGTRPITSTTQHSQPADALGEEPNLTPEKQIQPSSLQRRLSRVSTRHGQAGIDGDGDEDENNPHFVHFPSGDRRDPRQWSKLKKWGVLFVYLIPEFWLQVISTIFAAATAAAAADVGVSETAMRTVQAIYLFGFAAGPVVVAPLSEDYGRRPVVLVCLVIIALCQIPCALAGSIALILPFRFIAGAAAAAGFNSIGVVNDIFTDAIQQGWGVNVFALTAELGLDIGTVIGGYAFQAYGWRWTFGISGIVTAVVTVIVLFGGLETRGGVILTRMAKKQRKATGDGRFYCHHERVLAASGWKDKLTESIGRPVWMLLTEPIVVATTVYDGLNYAILYAFVVGFSVVYGEVYEFDAAQQTLPFIGLFVGTCVAFCCLPLQQAWERRAARRSETGEAEVEEKLAWLVTTPLFPISLFWFAWTAVPSVPWPSSVVAGGFFGFSSHIIFVAVSDYTAGAYFTFAASAIGAQSLLREIVSGAFTLFTVQMYHKLGNPWASSLLAFLAIIVCILPFLLYAYGPRLRAHSPFCRQQIEDLRRKRKMMEAKGLIEPTGPKKDEEQGQTSAHTSAQTSSQSQSQMQTQTRDMPSRSTTICDTTPATPTWAGESGVTTTSSST